MKLTLGELVAELGRRKRQAQHLKNCSIMNQDSGPSEYYRALDELEIWVKERQV